MPTTDKATAAPPAERTPARRPIRYDVLCKFLIAVCFFAYIFIRILRLDVTADELAQEFPLADIFSLERIEEQLQPLVYVFSTVSKDIFPFDEVTELRLPCVLAFVLYAWGAFTLSGLVRPRWLSVLTFAALFGDPFLIDFFSLQRGYCFTAAFTLLSVVALLRMLDAEGCARDRRRNAAIWWGFFAFLSNLAALHFYLCLCAIIIFLSVDWKRVAAHYREIGFCLRFPGQLIARNQYLLANMLMVTIFWAPRIIIFRKRGELYSGGNVGFIHDTIGTLVATAFYDIRITDPLSSGIALGIACLATFIAFHSLLRARESVAYRRTLLVSSILLLFALGSVLMHMLMDVRYLWQRTALYLVPLFIAQVALYATALARWTARVGAALLFTGVIALFAWNANFSHTLGWHMNSKTRKVLHDLSTLHRPGDGVLVLGISDHIKPKFEYYRKRMGLDWLKWYPIDMYTRFNGQYQIHPETSYFYILENDGDLPEPLNQLPIDKTRFEYPGSRCALYKVRDGADLGTLLGTSVNEATPGR